MFDTNDIQMTYMFDTNINVSNVMFDTNDIQMQQKTMQQYLGCPLPTNTRKGLKKQGGSIGVFGSLVALVSGRFKRKHQPRGLPLKSRRNHTHQQSVMVENSSKMKYGVIVKK